MLLLLFVFIILSNNYTLADRVNMNSLTLIPVRDAFEKLGYLVMWNQSDRTILLIDQNNNKDKIVLNENDNIVSKLYSFIILNNKAFCSIEMLKNLNGETRNLRDFEGKKTVLVFWTQGDGSLVSFFVLFFILIACISYGRLKLR